MDREIVKLFKALSDATRQDILELLCESEMNVSDICGKFHSTQPTISHHLQVLKNCNLIDSRKQGKNIYYHVKREIIRDMFGDVIERFQIEIEE